jgi:hypothetical protein
MDERYFGFDGIEELSVRGCRAGVSSNIEQYLHFQPVLSSIGRWFLGKANVTDTEVGGCLLGKRGKAEGGRQKEEEEDGTRGEGRGRKERMGRGVRGHR